MGNYVQIARQPMNFKEFKKIREIQPKRIGSFLLCFFFFRVFVKTRGNIQS